MYNLKQKIGIRLRELRKSKDFKQHELAERVGVDSKTISRIEVGGNFPSFELLEKICSELNLDMADFFRFNSDNSDNRKAKIQNAVSLLSDNEVEVLIGLIKRISITP